MELYRVNKIGEKQGTAYGFECKSNGTWGRFSCGITKKPFDVKEKTPAELAHDAEIAKRLKEDPWAVYVTDPQGNISKYNMDAQVSGGAGPFSASCSLRDGCSTNVAAKGPDPRSITPSAKAQICIKKDAPKPKDPGITYSANADHLTASYNPTTGQACSGLTSSGSLGFSASTPASLVTPAN